MKFSYLRKTVGFPWEVIQALHHLFKKENKAIIPTTTSFKIVSQNAKLQYMGETEDRTLKRWVLRIPPNNERSLDNPYFT